MLAGFESRSSHRVFAEVDKTTDLIPQFRQRLIVAEGESFLRSPIISCDDHIYIISYHDLIWPALSLPQALPPVFPSHFRNLASGALFFGKLSPPHRNLLKLGATK